MTPEDFQRAEDLFHQLRDVSEEERNAVLATACPDDSGLRREVIRLIEADRQAENRSFLAGRAIEDASRLITPRTGGDGTPVLSPGAQLGPYRVLSQIGRGGMGEVYRAHDTQLHRDVAIKVLGSALANDEQYMERFQYEAKILASLNHPNIATIYGIEQRALVMELVEGENLHGPLPLQEAMRIARQIAVALEAAHERGIVHRDLKPGNIRITAAGQVKLLDFGLAKLSAVAADDPMVSPGLPSPTSASVTVAGTVIGSAAYMAPEQAKARPADKRADIWAFGAVFYELLTGERLFAGETIAETLAAVVRGEPDLSRLPPETPPHVRHLLVRCLRKDPMNRLRDIGEARIALDEPPAEAAAVKRGKGFMAAAAGLTAIGAGVFLFWPRPEARQMPSFRLAVPPPDRAGFSLVSLPALSPNGRYLAFATGSGHQARLWIRDLTGIQSHEIPSTEGAFDPFWSPDSRSIAFFVPGKLKRVNVDHGPVTTICDASDGRGGTWNRDGVIVFAPTFGSPLYRVSGDGGTPELLGELRDAQGETSQAFPWFLPDGEHYLYTSRNADPARNGIFVASLNARTRLHLVSAPSNAVYSPPGYLLYVRAGTLMAQSFDASQLRTTGEPFTVADEVGFLPGSLQGQFAVSQSGLLSYYSGSHPLLSQLTWVNRGGKAVETVGEPDVMQAPALSPDGNTIAIDRLDPAIGTYDVWLYKLPDHAFSRFTFDAANDIFPVWSQDGKSILFSSDQGGQLGLYEKSANGASGEHLLLQMAGVTLPTDRAGRGLLLFSNQAPRAVGKLFSLPLTKGAKPVPLFVSRASESHGRLSPDGHWLAYDSDETGSAQVFVSTFPETSGRWQISGENAKAEGGTRPLWSQDGRELFYISTSGKVMRVPVGADATFTHGQPTRLFEARMPPMSPFEINRHGSRFLILNGIQPDVTTPITVVVNWQNAGKP
jgi:Tol biopolymer transport system component/predicted Ser/Thr protein kinase